jgi:hypothetical protein
VLVAENRGNIPPLLMRLSRIIASVSVAAACFSAAAPALAATSDDFLAEQKAFKASDLCEGRNQRDQGRCIGDAIKHMKALLKDFNDALAEERAQWYKDNSNLGATTEYQTLLRAYLTEISAKRKLFRDQQKEIEKLFFSERKTVRENTLTEKTTYTRKITSADMDAAKEKCAKQTDSSGLRVCLRQQLKLIDPTTRQLNISPDGARTR